MTNRLAVALAVLLAGGIALDVWFHDSRHLLFLARRLFALIDWMAFWR